MVLHVRRVLSADFLNIFPSPKCCIFSVTFLLFSFCGYICKSRKTATASLKARLISRETLSSVSQMLLLYPIVDSTRHVQKNLNIYISPS